MTCQTFPMRYRRESKAYAKEAKDWSELFSLNLRVVVTAENRIGKPVARRAL